MRSPGSPGSVTKFNALPYEMPANFFKGTWHWYEAPTSCLSAESDSISNCLTPEDASGLKFRIMSSKVLEAQMKAVGANPQVLPFSEVYSALQQRVVDACENPLSNFFTQKFYEVQTDLTMSNHGYLGYLVVTNKIFWKKLMDDQQKLITKATQEATVYSNDLAKKMDEDYLGKIKATGKTNIHESTAEQRKAWKDKMLAIYPDFYNIVGKDLIEEAIAEGK
jgi:C4-dicarboxylate-binding protein DctP